MVQLCIDACRKEAYIELRRRSGASSQKYLCEEAPEYAVPENTTDAKTVSPLPMDTEAMRMFSALESRLFSTSAWSLSFSEVVDIRIGFTEKIEDWARESQAVEVFLATLFSNPDCQLSANLRNRTYIKSQLYEARSTKQYSGRSPMLAGRGIEPIG